MWWKREHGYSDHIQQHFDFEDRILPGEILRISSTYGIKWFIWKKERGYHHPIFLFVTELNRILGENLRKHFRYKVIFLIYSWHSSNEEQTKVTKWEKVDTL